MCNNFEGIEKKNNVVYIYIFFIFKLSLIELFLKFVLIKRNK